MAEQPFKYSIHFPDSDNPNEEESEKNSFEIIHKSEAEDLTPVVVLLGWAGCQEKHLAKYSHMYEKKGFVTVNVSVPAKTLFFQPYKVGQVAEGLLSALAQKITSHHPVIFHVFSNGGCMVYSQVTALLNTPECQHYSQLSVRGAIFDSSPGKQRIRRAVKAFMSTVRGHALQRYFLGLCLLVFLFVTRVLLRLLPSVFSSSSSPSSSASAQKGFQLYDEICEDPCLSPQLFLYSRADKVILAEDVEEVMVRRREKGVSVASVCWEDSQHVAHFRQHPEVYTKACLDFTTACLQAPSTSASPEVVRAKL